MGQLPNCNLLNVCGSEVVALRKGVVAGGFDDLLVKTDALQGLVAGLCFEFNVLMRLTHAL